MRLIAILLVMLHCAFAQTPPRASGVVVVFNIPSGDCPSNAPLRHYAPTTQLYGCKLSSPTSLTGTWTAIAGGGGGSGTVTSVSFTTSVGSVTGSPITTSGTINYSFTAANVVSLFSGCSGTQYLGADGACHTASGSGTVTSIATSSPITGGTITTTGTIGCASCVTGAANLTTTNAVPKQDGTVGELTQSGVLVDSSNNVSAPGSVSSGVGSGTTGQVQITGSTSGLASVITVDNNNTATTVKIPNDSTAGLYLPTTTSATPSAGCAQFNGTSTEVTSSGSPCLVTGSYPTAFNFVPYFNPLGLSLTSPVTVANTNSATTILGSTFSGTSHICAGCVLPGRTIMLTAGGTLGTAIGVPTLSITVIIGGVTVATLTPTLIGSLSTDAWTVNYRLTIQSLSAVEGAGCFDFPISGGTVNACASATTSGLAFASDQVIDLQATWGTASSSNTITANYINVQVI